MIGIPNSSYGTRLVFPRIIYPLCSMLPLPSAAPPPLQLDTRVETPSPLLTIRHIAIYDSYDTL